MSLLPNSRVNKRRGLFRWAPVAILGLAVAAILFLASGAAFLHYDAPGSVATCPICHFAHMPVLLGAHATIIVARSTIAWIVATNPRLGHAPADKLHSPPRAPPA